jgi:hypothetical protein
VLRWAPTAALRSKPISLYADKITTWLEKGQRVFLARGKVWISQDLVSIRFQEGVLFVDESSTGSGTRIVVYAEGSLQIEEGLRSQRGQRGVLDLGTRGDLRIKATGGAPPSETPAPADPLLQRALAMGLGPGAYAAGPASSPSSGIQLTGAVEVPPGQQGPGGLQQAGFADASGPPPASGQPAGPGVVGPGPQPNQGPAKEGAPGKLTQMPTPRPVVPTPAKASAGPKQITVRPRSVGQELQIRSFDLPNGEKAVVISSGAILNVTSPTDTVGVLDIEADQLAFWTRKNTQEVLDDLRTGQGQNNDSLEFYLAGNVEIRTHSKTEVRVLRCDEAYYDVHRHVAVALKGHMEMIDPRVKYPFVIDSQEMLQLDEDHFEAVGAQVSASALPYDPGLKVNATDATLENRQIQRRTIFGLPIIDLKTGQPLTETQRYFTGRNVVMSLEGVPFFYSPILKGDAEHPFGPLESVGANYNHIFGFQLFTTWDMYQLIGITRIPDTRWRLDLDYLSMRGPAVGTAYEFFTKEFLGIKGTYTGLLKAYGIADHGDDVLGGGRGTEVLVSNPPPVFDSVVHPEGRGRIFGRLNAQDMPDGFMAQVQLSVLSDQNFLEQYYLQEFQNGFNQETFLYVKQQQEFWAWTALVEPYMRPWETETEWLPKLQGDLLGVSLFDLFTYNLKSSAGFGRLRTTDVPAFAFSPTDQNVSTGRFDLWQDISLPFKLGAFNIVPYATFDLTYYTEDLNGNPSGRVYGGGGVRASFPLSRLYPDVHSELLNVNGIYHKINFTGNFYDAFSSVHFNQYPQLDRMNDDTSDQALRDIFPWQSILNPSNATALTMSPLFNPQVMALRKLVLDEVDTRDDMEVVQLDILQRWQTKRGLPGNEHVVDWMTLDLSASVFPQRNRDNFGNYLAFLEYDWAWNIGDRTSLVSTGWADPISGGPHVFTIGANLNRPDRTNFYLGYRQLDPLQSKALIGSATFAFSPKYAVTASIVDDFGIHATTYSVMLTRIGTDVQMSLGVSHSTLLNTFGLQFEILPVLVADRVHAVGGAQGFMSTGSVGR